MADMLWLAVPIEDIKFDLLAVVRRESVGSPRGAGWVPGRVIRNIA